MNQRQLLQNFKDLVLVKNQVYNGFFYTLPFKSIKKAKVLLPLFKEYTAQGFKEKKAPLEIINGFFEKYQPGLSEKERLDLLFKFIQFIERQVVLFDAAEEAAYPHINALNGSGSLAYSLEMAESFEKETGLKTFFKNNKVRIVLTAHPTQFYPGNVLAIITDLAKAIEANDMPLVQKLIEQLGVTPFYKRKKPTPLDEAVSLIWYLENILYQAVSDIYTQVQNDVFEGEPIGNSFLEIGFWPGGDRDGNPFVTTETTLETAQKLREAILKKYYGDVKKLRRRLTFKNVAPKIKNLEKKLYKAVFKPKKNDLTLEELLESLYEIKQIITDQYESLFVEEIQKLINRVHLFGLHFASLDIRQDSSVHERVFDEVKSLVPGLLPEDFEQKEEIEQLDILSRLYDKLSLPETASKQTRETLASMQAIAEIQARNGEKGAHRYIISNTQSAAHIMKVFALLKMSGFGEELPVDVVPLFETVEDLKNAASVMEKMYQNPVYRQHLQKRGNRQTIMLGFSDGTKDGGYLKANWSIYRAKEQLTAIARKYDVNVTFFDGRGGPPARGGGKTHMFYASLGNEIAHDEIQLTVQGQSISSFYGNLYAAKYNLEQLISAGLSNILPQQTANILTGEQKEIFKDLSDIAYKAYLDLKNHPKFIPYLEKMSTLKYYGQTKIGSRPSKRKQSDRLIFSDLRAIPFVGSWSLLKQNVPGYYGVGTALETYMKQGKFEVLKDLYKNSNFFKALIENSMMSLTKSFFELTAYMKNDPEFGDFWQLLYDEYKRSKKLILQLTGQKKLMENYPVSKMSIKTREQIVLPLLGIQQFALQRLQTPEVNSDQDLKETYEKLVVRSLYGNINASRNSA